MVGGPTNGSSGKTSQGRQVCALGGVEIVAVILLLLFCDLKTCQCTCMLQIAWTEEEDEKLKALVAEHGTKKWTLIASKLGTKAAKQCRQAC